MKIMLITSHDLTLWDLVPHTIDRWTYRARVIEDRGHIGIGGRQIVRFEALDEEDFEPEPRRFELAVAEAELEPPAAKCGWRCRGLADQHV